jgi:hypothetical protein
MKKKIKKSIVDLKSSLDKHISPNKQKILGTMATVPLVAASAMSGASASGCPFGLVNCAFPGQCSRYIDMDGNGICDLSQTVITTTSPQTTSSSSDPSISTQNVNNNVNDDQGSQNINSDPSNSTVIQDPGNSGLDSSSVTDGNNYHILPISLLIIGGYIFTYYLFKKGILKPQQHKRIWNLLLVGGYVGTGATGILLTFMINLGISTVYNPGITYWHAELAILMVIVTLIHIHIYKKPFKNMFKVLFGFKSSSKKNEKRKSINMSK